MTSLLNSTAITERMIDLPGGEGFNWHKSQDVESIVNEVKDRGEQSTRSIRNGLSRRLIGTVPNLIALEWAKEWGVALNSKEWTSLAKKRLQNDPNWRRLKVDHQK